MNTKHTRGPWDFGLNVGVLSKKDGTHIADISATESFNETLANAKLIAAAPELLEALFKFMEMYGDCTRNMPLEMVAKEFYSICTAAIQKATE